MSGTGSRMTQLINMNADLNIVQQDGTKIINTIQSDRKSHRGSSVKSRGHKVKHSPKRKETTSNALDPSTLDL